ncbi:proline--tRNA ligase [Candidatus Pacearchaeota archaeon]|nr:proline--tRNA ligase [Candidatus Pacearchaeota archaeon]
MYTEIKERNKKKYYYRVKSIRKGEKVDKERVYLGVNLNKNELKAKEDEADKKLSGKSEIKIEKIEEKPQEKQERKIEQPKASEKKVTFNISKKDNFSDWYTDIVQKAELGDVRYNVKGFIVFQPWSVLSMEKMFKYLEKVLQKKNHKPYWFPTLIPEKNLKLESEHIGGFTPQVFWVTTHGNNEPIEEKLALRPTSETAFYQMFSLWISSYKDLPFKTYQRANIFRYESKATRPFLRSREFHWIETHCAHANMEDAMKQVHEDMNTTKEVLHDIYCLPFIFFERPSWDKFPGAERTFATDVLNPDGKVVQQPSTHLIKQDFAKAFNIKFKDKDGKDKYVWTTCYGPAVSRIFASVIAVHGDEKGLKFPWKIAPLQVIIVVIGNEKKVLEEAKKIKSELEQKEISCEIDSSKKRPGDKFYFWEMKGVPLRIDLGNRDIKSEKLTFYRRDTMKKDIIARKELLNYIEKTSRDIDKNLIKQADKLFDNSIINVKNKNELKKAVDSGKIARAGFCSIEKSGEKCAEVIEKEILASVRGTKLEKEKPEGKTEKCVICGKKASSVVYIAKSY